MHFGDLVFADIFFSLMVIQRNGEKIKMYKHEQPHKHTNTHKNAFSYSLCVMHDFHPNEL